MDKVYRQSFLNISATAATNSDGGLFHSRRPELLLEDEVLLNIEGIPGVAREPRTVETPAEPSPKLALISLLDLFEQYWFTSYLLVLLRHLYVLVGRQTSPQPKRKPDVHGHSQPMKATSTSEDVVTTRDESPSRDSEGEPSGETDRKNLRRCTILDVSFWTDRIDKAPVNTRGWVLQERLMAPRVLHFCRDQVAWECTEFDAAEGQPQGMPNFQLTGHGIVDESRLKGLKLKADGGRLRRMRLQGFPDPDPHLQPTIWGLELWRRIVEVYSKTAITNPEDKLIALSGMARWMAQKIGSPNNPAKYVAGLWELHLASQLLWRTEPVFRENIRENDSYFEHLSTAPEEYRAPSFSWASIDTEKGHGITYAEVTDRDLLIEVDQVEITPKSEANEYGMVSSGHLFLRGKLRKANLFNLPELPKRPKGRFGWKLVDRENLDTEEHTNVYLDCPARDKDSILGPDAGVYIVPAARGDRTASEESKYLTCLILQLIKGHARNPAFRRIGLTKLSPWADNKALHQQKILEVYGSDVDMPHHGYDPETGMHRILIV